MKQIILTLLLFCSSGFAQVESSNGFPKFMLDSTSFTGCSLSCGGGIMTRQLICKTRDGEPTDLDNCPEQVKIEEGQYRGNSKAFVLYSGQSKILMQVKSCNIHDCSTIEN